MVQKPTGSRLAYADNLKVALVAGVVVAHVTMPVDIQSQAVSADKRSPRNVAHHVSPAMADAAPAPTDRR